MAVNVPNSQVSMLQSAAAAIGIPYSVVAAQVADESGFNASAQSSVGAEGEFQFMPSTYTSLGFPAGTEYDASEEVQAYIKYMKELLSQEGGSVYKALEAYNAGPTNLSAGAGYASSILGAAGESNNIQAGTSSASDGNASASTDSDTINDLVAGAIKTVFSGIGNNILKAVGTPSVKDLLIRAGLLIVGVVILIIGLHSLTEGSSNSPSTNNGVNVQLARKEEEHVAEKRVAAAAVV